LVTARVATGAVFLLFSASCQAFAEDNASVHISDAKTACSSFPEGLTVVGDVLAFAVEDGLHGRELWMRDGDGLPVLVADLWPGPTGSNPRRLTPTGHRLYFVADSDRFGTELWLWDTGDYSLKMVNETSPGPQRQEVEVIATSPDTLYFVSNLESDLDLWAVAIGTTIPCKLRDLYWKPERGSYGCAVSPEGELILFLPGGGLWLARRLESGLRRIVETPCRPDDITSSCFLRDRLVFAGKDWSEYGEELWVYEASANTVTLLRDIYPGKGSASLGGLFAWNNSLYFEANDGEHGLELWSSDGTSDGTRLVKDINPGAPGSDPHYFCPAGPRLYFVADDGMHGPELWQTDGFAEGTALVHDVYPGARGGAPWSLTEWGEQLFFCAESPTEGEEVWMADGTPSEVRLLADIVPGPASSGPDNLTAMSDALCFTADDGVYGEELWMTDGTTRGTRLAADIAPPRRESTSRPASLTAVGDRLFFVAEDGHHGRELWTSDGSPEGTRVLLDLVPGPLDSQPERLTAADPFLFFTADDRVSGRELWCSDGTSEGTRLVSDILPGPEGSEPDHVVALDAHAYFLADDGKSGRRLWQSDGTQHGTTAVQDSAHEPTAGAIADLFILRGKVYFYVGTGNSEWTFYRWIPEQQRTELLLVVPESQPIANQEAVWAQACSGARPPETAEDLYTALVAHPCSVDRARDHPERSAPLVMDSCAFFVAYAEREGAELWRTEGNPDRMICVSRNAFPGSCSSSPSCLTLARERVYFLADTSQYGRILWNVSIDGTDPRPVDHADEEGQPIAVRAKEIACAGNQLFLSVGTLPRGVSQRWRLGFLELTPQGEFSDEPLHASGNASVDQAADPDVSAYRLLQSPCFIDWEADHEFTAVGDRVLFVADDGIHGEELWITDGTSTGTRLVRDIVIPRCETLATALPNTQKTPTTP